MAYTKTTFVNGRAPAVSAEELNKFGQGIADAHNMIANNAIITGVFTGDGTASRTINLGFTPKAIMVFRATNDPFTDGYAVGEYYVGGIAVTGFNHVAVNIVTGGFMVFNNSAGRVVSNSNGVQMGYIAFKEVLT